MIPTFSITGHVTGLPCWSQLCTGFNDPISTLLEFDLVTDEGERWRVMTSYADPLREGELHGGCQVIAWGYRGATDIDEEPILRAHTVAMTIGEDIDFDAVAQPARGLRRVLPPAKRSILLTLEPRRGAAGS